MSGLCCIVAAGEIEPGELVITPDAFVIAADAGLVALRAAGRRPDMTVGDFDSLNGTPEDGGEILCHPPEKDDTDTLLAVREALRRGYDTILIYGALGGRPDHSFANIQVLRFIAEAGAAGYIAGGGWLMTAVKNGGLRFRKGLSGTVSVFSLTSESSGVYLRGLKYPLSNATVSSGFPIGVSNEFTGGEAEISVKEGVLAVFWQGRTLDFSMLERTRGDRR